MPTIDMDTTAADAALLGSLPDGLRVIPIEQLHPHPSNPRTDLGDLTELAADIREHGIMQPLLVVPDPGDPHRYRVIIGHRRHAAAPLAGLTEVPAIVDPTLTERQQLARMISENVQREALTVVEEANGYQGLLDLGMTVEEAAQQTGRSESTVRRRLKLVTLPEEARAKVHAGQATLDDVVKLPDESTVTKQQYKKLIDALGTSNFSWTLIEVERSQRNKEKWAELERELAAKGIEVVKKAPDGYRYAQQAWGGIPKDATSKWVFVPTSRPSGEYYRPATKGERVADREKAAQEQRRRDEEAAAAARAEKAAQLAEISARTRRDFIAAAVQRKNAKAPALLVDFLATFSVTKPRSVYSYPNPDDLDVAHIKPDVYAARSAGWFGLDVAALLAEDASALARMFVDAWEKTAPAGRLLVLIATAVEPHLDAAGWASADDSAAAIRSAWYELLTALGYTPSDAEKAALAGNLDALPGDDPDND